MSNDIKISIIIPVYNVEKYLKQCLDSIINQTFIDFECICVNDDSTDNSLNILQEYAKKDKRIKIISQKNTGVAMARNTGLSVATGDYILFIDSDDFIDNNFCEVLYNDAKKYNCDISFAERFDFDNNIKKKWSASKILGITKNFEINNSNRFFYFYKFLIICSSVGKLIRRELIKTNNILFYNTRRAEDKPFSSLLALYVNSIYANNTVYYHYRLNNNRSLSKSMELTVKADLENLKILKKDIINRRKDDYSIIKIIDLAVCDILFGYFDIWNAGTLSRCSIKATKEIFQLTKNDYFTFFNLKDILNDCDNKIIKTKYNLFCFALKYNIYLLPKIVRVLRNIPRNIFRIFGYNKYILNHYMIDENTKL